MKKSSSHRSLVLTAAVAAALGAIATLTPATFGQYLVNSGHALDASNRVGSGGINSGGSSSLPPGVFNNAIVTGNVTGGIGFQGNIPYYAPGAFHAALPGAFVDNFVAQSTNVQTNGTIVDNAQNVHLFLGDDRGVNPPSNFVSTGAQPGYIPAAVNSDTQFTSDTRLGGQAVSSPVSNYVPSSIFQTGGTQGGGAVSTYQSASPLFGVKSLQTQQQNDGTQQYSGSSVGGGPLQSSAIGSGDRTDLSTDLKVPTLSDTTAMNSDMTGSAGPGGLGGLGTAPGVASFAVPSANGRTSTANPANTGSQGPGAAGGAGANATGANAAGSAAGVNPSNSISAGPLGGQNANGASSNGQIGGTAVTAAVPSGYPLNTAVNGNALSGSLNTGEDSYTNIYSPTSNQPGSAYSRMILRLKAINPNAPLTPQQRNLLNQAKLQDIRAAAQANGTAPKPGETRTAPGANLHPASPELPAPPSGMSQPGLPPPGGMMPAAPAIPQQVVPADKEKPVAINSFSNGANSSAADEHLSKAEDFMKQGKFTSALEEYDLVEQTSPSNPYVQLGRANAELGASYYGLAEAHLRQAFMTDQALLSAQLDLRKFLGDDKLQYLVKDLKEIAQANPTESRPVFLLAYICYNTNNPRGAAAYLDLAEKREGKPDPFFKLLREHWDLPDSNGGSGDTDLNK